MPNMDRTGPNGQGARTGRQMGHCGGNSQGNINGRGMGLGRGRGLGRGLSRGFRRNTDSTEINLNKDEQIKVLEAEKIELEKQLKQLKDE